MEFIQDLQPALVVTALIVAGVLYICRRSKGSQVQVLTLNKILPGPVGLPIVGNLLQIDSKRAHRTFGKWAQQFGPIYGIRIGSCRAIVLSDPALIREAFNDPNFCGRPENKVLNVFSGGKNGIIQADGSIWSEQRRFTLRHLRNFSFGKSSMEALIMNEVTELLESFKKEEGNPVCPNRRFSLAILNGLWMIVTGNRYSHDDPVLTNILKELFQAIDKAFSNGLLMFFPALPTYIPNLSGYNGIAKSVDFVTDIFRQIVEEHKETHVSGEPRDFIDAYLDEVYKTGDCDSSFHPDHFYKHLLAVVFDLFAAGSETTSNTLTWTILYLVKFPEVQIKLQKEIDMVIGKNRLPSLTDRPKMPYAEAIINEVLRYSETIVLGLFHSTIESTIFHGYYIPKDTYVLSNFYTVHRDPAIWTDPEKFRPERFMSVVNDGDTFSSANPNAFLAFSVGKRVCLGEATARDEMFLFMTSIFQKFNVELDSSSATMGDELLEPQAGFMNVAKEFYVRLTDRLQ